LGPGAIRLIAVGGFNSTDVTTLSASDFANYQVLQQRMSQSGAKTLITLDVSDQIALVSTQISSLRASNFRFV
jgi:hypothetical protein